MTGHSTAVLTLQLLRLPTFFYPPKEGTEQPPTFRPMSTVAKRSPISATAELF